jgi:hypothetical protein
VTVFHDADEKWMVQTESEIDPTRDHGKIESSTLKNFLSRPVLINSFSIARNANVDIILDPWSLYMSNAQVSEKLDNFYLFRGKMCIKMVINGSGFYYGHFLAYYVPQSLDDDKGSFIRGDSLDNVVKTVYPHIWLDPTTSRGGEMKLPFYNAHNWISLPEATQREMGRLFIQDIVQLKHANDLTPHPVRVSVFAWFEDVEICHTTERARDTLSPQAGVGAALTAVVGANQASKDEYGEGIVSHISSVAANAAHSLSGIPLIGKFAKATERASNKIHRFARFIGFSRPRQIREIQFVQNFDGGHLAATDQHDTSRSLALTSKQELTVDPRVTGLGGTDEMSVQFIAGKEAILQTVSLNPATAVADDLVWNSVVSPMLYQKSGNEIRFTPMAHLSVPFRWWTGTIIFRFQITASAYHRGRLRVTWDPLDQPSGPANYNLNYSRVVDIAQERDFEVPITWAQYRSWAEVDDYDRATSAIFGTTGSLSVRRNTANGVVGLYLVNEIAVPNTAADDDVFITISARAGDDFRLAGPREDRMEGIYFQSGLGSAVSHGGQEGNEADLEGTGLNTPGNPDATNSLAPIGTPSSDSNLYDVYFGEQGVASIRQILKRYCFVNCDLLTGAPAAGHYSLKGHVLPPYPGTGTGDDLHDATTPATTCTYANMTPLAWFLFCYTGFRGSIRWKFSVVDAQTAQSQVFGVKRSEPATSAEIKLGVTVTDLTQNRNSMAEASLAQGNLFSGALAMCTLGEGTIEAEFPFYSNRRFAPCRSTRNTVSTYDFGKGHMETWEFFYLGDTNTTTNVAKYVATGEDFSLSYYVGPPRMTVAALPVA